MVRGTWHSPKEVGQYMAYINQYIYGNCAIYFCPGVSDSFANLEGKNNITALEGLW